MSTYSDMVKRIFASLRRDPPPGVDVDKLLHEAEERMTTMPLPKPPGGSYIPYGVSRFELPPEAGDILGVASQTGRVVVLDCTHSVVTITFPDPHDPHSWDVEPKIKVDLLPMPTAGMGF